MLKPLMYLGLLMCCANCSCSNGKSASEHDSGSDTELVPGCSDGWYDESTGLCWQDPQNSWGLYFHEAVDYCNQLELGEEDDWRLPDIHELRGLVRGCQPTATGGACPIAVESIQSAWTEECYGCAFLCGPGKDGLFWDHELNAEFDDEHMLLWSSSISLQKDFEIWIIDFAYGHVIAVDPDGHWEIRCVRTVDEGTGVAPDQGIGADCDPECDIQEIKDQKEQLTGAVSQADPCFNGLILVPEDDGPPTLEWVVEYCWWGGFMMCGDIPAPSAELTQIVENAKVNCLGNQYNGRFSVEGQSGHELGELISIVLDSGCSVNWDNGEFVIKIDQDGNASQVVTDSSDEQTAADCVKDVLAGHVFPCLAGFDLCACYGYWE